MLVEAFRAIADEFVDVNCVIAGPDSDGCLSELVECANRCGLNERVTFTGMLQGMEKWDAIEASSVFVLPSLSEGFSVAVLEALGCGRPVVVTKACNFDGIVKSGCGWEVNGGVDSIAQGIGAALCLREEELAAVGAAAAKLVSAEYSWSKVSGDMCSMYRWLGGGKRPEGVRVVE